MNEPNQGLLAVWMNVDPALEADFDAWYTREHVPERVGVPGFRNGCRYEALQGEPRFLAVYDTQSPEVLRSPPYQERLDNPTPWTQRVMPGFRDTVRVVGRVLAAHGQGTGAFLRTLRIEPQAGRRDALRDALAGDLLQRLRERPGIARVRFAEAVETGPVQATAETEMRGGPDRSATFVVLVDATDPGALEAACEALLSAGALTTLGAQPAPEVGDYRLLLALADEA